VSPASGKSQPGHSQPDGSQPGKSQSQPGKSQPDDTDSPTPVGGFVSSAGTGAAAMQRVRVLYRGHVQGVGFRYTTCRVAERFQVTGIVRNLPDGNVELMAEGPADELARFIQAIDETLAGNIRERTTTTGSARNEFADFRIAY
jgi:acylphosphatase